MNNNLTSELRADKNGKLTTRHVRTDKDTGSTARATALSGAAPSLGSSTRKPKFKRNWSGFSFEDGYSDDYVPAGVEVTVENNGSKSTSLGSKYTGYVRTTEVAKGLREDIKEAIEAGYLPDGPKYSVKASSAAGTQDVSISVSGLPDSKIYDGLTTDRWGDKVRKPSDFTVELNSRLELMANSYNRVIRDGGNDHYQHMYYSYVNIKDEEAVQWANEQAAQKRREREERIQRNLG